MSSEISQAQKNKYHMFSFMCRSSPKWSKHRQLETRIDTEAEEKKVS